MLIFDGYRFAQEKEESLRARVTHLQTQGQQPHIAAILFEEDMGSQLYTRLKREAAARVGIIYDVFSFSMRDPVGLVVAKIAELNADPAVTGIIIQKPWRASWIEIVGGTKADFTQWWQKLVGSLQLSKDVDGLHPQTLAAIKDGSWQTRGMVLPATAKAVLDILQVAEQQLIASNQTDISPEGSLINYCIIGKSDLLGQPLFYELQNQGKKVEMIGSKELKSKIEQGIGLRDKQVVITATGRNKLITGELLSPGTVVIDVGEPKPDVDRDSVAQVASFLTPVPGGVGPVTVVSLLENAVDLLEK